jgi:hypothetical protein
MAGFIPAISFFVALPFMALPFHDYDLRGGSIVSLAANVWPGRAMRRSKHLKHFNPDSAARRLQAVRFQDRVASLAQLGPVLLQTSEKGVIPVVVFEVTAKLAHIAAACGVFFRRAALHDVDFAAVAALREDRR